MSDEPGADWFERALRQLSDRAATDETNQAEREQRHMSDASAGGDLDADADRSAAADNSDAAGVRNPGPDQQSTSIPEDDPFGGVRRKSERSSEAGLDSANQAETNAVRYTEGEDADDPFSEPAFEGSRPGNESPEPVSTSNGDSDDDMATDTVSNEGPTTETSHDPFGGSRKQSSDSSGDSGNTDPFGDADDDFGFAEFSDAGHDPERVAVSADPGTDDEPAQFSNSTGGASDALEDAGSPTGAGDGPPGFDPNDESFDSAIDRIDIGIAGLDEMILGGVPSSALMSVVGSAGTGKTTFALQFLNEAVVNGGKAVYLTLEESREAILQTAEEKGWPFREYVADDRLAIVALDPIEMASSLASIRNDLSRLISTFGADRLVLDSVSLLEMMYDHPAKRRSEVFEFTRSLKQAGVTTLLTSEASNEDPYTSRYGIVEYLTDAVFILQYVRSENYQETRLGVEILKIRDANHSRETKPYEISEGGISVYRQANIF